MSKSFDGFSFQKENLTPIPATFFTIILQKIKDIAELKVVLYALWWYRQSELKIPYMTTNVFSNDQIFMSGLAETEIEQTRSLMQGIKLAVEQKIFLKATVQIDNQEKNIYFLNTTQSKAVLKAIDEGNWQATKNELYPIKFIQEFPNIFTLYEENIGPITPLIADSLKEIENLYSPEWIEDAFKEAIKNNVRKLRYIEAILQTWQKEGKNDRTNRRRGKEIKEEDDPERYIKGKFSDFIEF